MSECTLPSIDYFEEYELLPDNMQTLLHVMGEDQTKEQLDAALAIAKALGWQFDYGLDLVPYSLRKFCISNLPEADQKTIITDAVKAAGMFHHTLSEIPEGKGYNLHPCE